MWLSEGAHGQFPKIRFLGSFEKNSTGKQNYGGIRRCSRWAFRIPLPAAKIARRVSFGLLSRRRIDVDYLGAQGFWGVRARPPPSSSGLDVPDLMHRDSEQSRLQKAPIEKGRRCYAVSLARLRLWGLDFDPHRPYQHLLCWQGLAIPEGTTREHHSLPMPFSSREAPFERPCYWLRATLQELPEYRCSSWSECLRASAIPAEP
jgi:hypothetical protein